jgi:hypothetical protein
MRVLIIAQPRTGSTVFSKWLSNELSLLWLDEPFNRQRGVAINQFFELDNILAKVIFEGNKGEWFYDRRIKSIDDLLSLNWDYVFTLTRNNVREQSISKVWSDENEYWYITKYKIDDNWLLKRSKWIEKQIRIFESDKKIVDSINSHKLIYEEIYSTKSNINYIKNLFNIDEFKYAEEISSDNRYRKESEYNGDDLFDKFKKKPYIRVL